VKLQDRKHSLAYENGINKFQLKPDFVLESSSNENKKVIIADTKWKVLDDEKTNNGVNQGDMYQLYAYGTKYKDVENMYLIYPKNNEVEETVYNYFNEDGRTLNLKIIFFDLENGNFLNDDLL
jgi:5-methylcytosine-specific restriction enzyme subunit McrC